MKIGRVRAPSKGGDVRLVAVDAERRRVFDLREAEERRRRARGATPEGARRAAAVLFPGSLTEALGHGEDLVARARELVERFGDEVGESFEAVEWLSPVDPVVLRDGMAFEEHVRNARRRRGADVDPVFYEIPVYYKVNPRTLIGTDSRVPWPPYSDSLDYELEVAFVVGRQAENLTPAEAREVIFGVALYNDFSARDIQHKEMRMQLGPAKGKDFATAIGPWVVTADELPWDELEVEAWLNGRVVSQGSLRDMTWRPEELVAFISCGETLLPGDVVASGTVGEGCGYEIGLELRPGDVVELRAAGIGALRNVVGEKGALRWWPTPKERASGDRA